MKIGQVRPKPQILKNQHKHNYRTQENSPTQLADHNHKVIGLTQFVIPQVARLTQRLGFGVKTIRSLHNSKQKSPDDKLIKMPIFGINFLKSNLQKEEILNFGSGRNKKNLPTSHRVITEKRNRFTQGSEKQQNYATDKTEKSPSGQTKIKFRLGSKQKNAQKTQQILQSPHKRQINEKRSQLNKKIISFPRSQRFMVQTAQIQQNHKSISKQSRKQEVFKSLGKEQIREQFSKSLRKPQIKLTPFQKEQLAHYEIFYIGPRRVYTQSDFTDNQGDPKISYGDSIAYRYQIRNQLGRGSFGRVFKAYDHKKKEQVALKLIKCQKKFQEQAKIQIAILQTALLKDPKFRSNVVRMKGSFVFRGHTCITFEILHKNLYQFLKEHQFAGFSQDLIRRFAIQILQSLSFFRKNRIIHCDLKPQNILLKQQNKSGIRVIDVGSGCFEQKQIYTYIQSRFYRAPQIILGIRYTPAIDMWSFGCILVQLFTGFPIFPGQSQNEQMLLFMEVLGYPPRQMLQIAERRKKFFDEDFQCKIPQEKQHQKIPNSVSLQEVIGSTDKSFLSLIRSCFQWNPKKRITPNDALMHEWILKGLPEPIREQHIDQLREQYYLQ